MENLFIIALAASPSSSVFYSLAFVSVIFALYNGLVLSSLLLLKDIFPLMLYRDTVSDWMHQLRPSVSQQEWSDFLLPLFAVIQLHFQDDLIGTFNICICLSWIYMCDLFERHDLSTPIQLHHILTIVMIFGSLIGSVITYFWYPLDYFIVHMVCTRLLLMAEWSTIFLNLKTVLKKLNYKSDWVSIVFFLTFISVRFGPAYYVLSNYPFMPLWILYILFLSINIYWCVVFIWRRLKKSTTKLNF